MQDLLGPITRQIEELESTLKEAGSREDADGAEETIARLRTVLEDLESDAAELKRKLHIMNWRFRSLPTTRAAAASLAEPSTPGFTWGDLASSTYMQKGWNCFAAGDYAGALENLQKAVDAAPGNSQIRAALGWAQTLSQHYEDALMTYQEVLAADPENALARVNLGYICFKKGIYGEAIEHLSLVIRDTSDRKAALYGNYYLGLVYLARDMHDDAVAFFERTIELGPAMSEAYYQLGHAHYLAGRTDEALNAWKRGTAANKFDPWATRCADAARQLEAGERLAFD